MKGRVNRIRTEDRQATHEETRLSCSVPSSFPGRVPGPGPGEFPFPLAGSCRSAQIRVGASQETRSPGSDPAQESRPFHSLYRDPGVKE